MARIVISGKFVSEPTKVIDIFGHRYLEIQLEESRKVITKHYSLYKVLFKGSQAKTLARTEELFSNYTYTIIGECFNAYGKELYVYAKEVYATRDRNGVEDVIKQEPSETSI